MTLDHSDRGHWCGSHIAIKRGDGIVKVMFAISCTLLFGYLWWNRG